MIRRVLHENLHIIDSTIDNLSVIDILVRT